MNGTVTTSGNGTLAPGNSFGTLTVNGPLTLGGIAVMELNKSGATLTSDLVNGITALTYGGTLALLANGDPLLSGDAFKLFNAVSYTGAFVTLNLPALKPGLSWDTTRLLSDGTIAVISRIPNTLSPNYVAVATTTHGHLIRFLGTAAQNYVVQQAGVLSGPWSDLSPVIPADGTGLVQFEDTNAPLPTVRFYRTHAVP